MILYYEGELSHHGINGQKWGKMNGPPYPLGSSQYSANERKLNKKDAKWAKKNSDKITNKAQKASKQELNSYAKYLLSQPGAYKTSGKVSAATVNAYNRKMAEVMSEKVSGLTSPSGKVVQFVAKRGELGVYMALADQGYDMSQIKNGVWNSGRVAYKKTVLDKA